MPAATHRGRAFLWGVVAALALVVAVLSIVGFLLRSQVFEQRDELAQQRARLSKIETRLIAEKAAQKVGEVATCYASARGRPRLITILRGIAVKLDPDPRDATNDLVDQYEQSTPTITECDRRALAAGLDPKDFPPANRGEEGNGR